MGLARRQGREAKRHEVARGTRHGRVTALRMQRPLSVNDLVHTCPHVVRDTEGRGYAASVHALERVDGLWETWLEFRGLGRDVTLRTQRESVQPDRRAVLYWAAGLQPSYLDGALLRATRARLTELRAMFPRRAA